MAENITPKGKIATQRSYIVRGREMLRDIERYASRSSNPLAKHGRRIYSQGKQDGMIAHILKEIGCKEGSSVEVGAWDGITYSNTRALLEQGWRCGYIEADSSKLPQLEWNIKGYDASAINMAISLEPNYLLDDAMDKLGMPEDMTLLCLDIDGIEYWVWKSLSRHRPRVVCIEYNAYLPISDRVTVPYTPDHQWSGDFFYGASAGALVSIGEEKGYSLVGFEPGLDLFFVRNDLLLKSALVAIPLTAIPQGTRFNIFRGGFTNHEDRMVEV